MSFGFVPNLYRAMRSFRQFSACLDTFSFIASFIYKMNVRSAILDLFLISRLSHLDVYTSQINLFCWGSILFKNPHLDEDEEFNF